MAQEITVFTNAQFGNIRAFKDGQGEPWFIAKDVCDVLGYKNSRDALKKHVDEEDVRVANRDTSAGVRSLNAINESGLYSLILRSNKSEAKEFKRWVTHEVLPAIRKDGGYIYTNGTESAEELMARALITAHSTLERKERIIREQQAVINDLEPKALLAEAIKAADGTCLVGELAKILTQAGFTVGQNRLFVMLREDGYLGKSGCNRNVPLQRYIEQGLFKIKETTVKHDDGHTTIHRTPKVTGKGQLYFLAKYAHVKQLPTEDIDS